MLFVSFVTVVQLRVSITKKWKLKLSSMIVNCPFYHYTVTRITARPYAIFGGLI